MNCKDIQELMWCGEFTSDVRLHLETCKRCRAERAMLQELGIAVEGVEIPRPTRSLVPPRAEIEAVIRAQKRRRSTKWLSVGLAAACVALAVTQMPSAWEHEEQTTPNDLRQTVPSPPNQGIATSQKTVEQQIQDYLTHYQQTPQSEQSETWAKFDRTVLAASTDEGKLQDNLSWFFQYANVFSRQIQLDLTPYSMRSDITTYLVPLRDRADEDAVFIVVGGTQVVGAWKRQVDGNEIISLDNKHFGEIAKMPWAEWVQAQKWETITPAMRARTPEELVVQYVEAKAHGDSQSIVGMFTPWSTIRHDVEGVEQDQQFTTGDLPIQRGLAASDVKVKELSIPAPDPSPVAKLHNRIPAESKVYLVTVPGGTRFVTVVREKADSPWQIDGIATGP